MIINAEDVRGKYNDIATDDVMPGFKPDSSIKDWLGPEQDDSPKKKRPNDEMKFPKSKPSPPDDDDDGMMPGFNLDTPINGKIGPEDSKNYPDMMPGFPLNVPIRDGTPVSEDTPEDDISSEKPEDQETQPGFLPNRSINGNLGSSQPPSKNRVDFPSSELENYESNEEGGEPNISGFEPNSIRGRLGSEKPVN